MLKTQKYHLKELPNRTVSETESESSSEEDNENNVLNLKSKVKNEPQYSTRESGSGSESDKVLTQISPSRINKQSTNFVTENISTFSKSPKKGKQDSLLNTEDENIFQTNKYSFNNSFENNSNNEKSTLQDNHESSSSSSGEEIALKESFLGQAKSKKKTPKRLKLSQSAPVPIKQKSDNEDSSDEILNTSSMSPLLQRHLVKVKDKSSLQCESTVNRKNSSQKVTPEKIKQKKNKKMVSVVESTTTDLSSIRKDENEVSDTQTSPKLSDVASSETSGYSSMNNKVQVLQNIKLSPMKPDQVLKELYPNITPINIRDSFEISNDDDIYLLRLPSTINPQHLMNTELSLTKGAKLKIDGEKYKLEPTNKPCKPYLFVGKRSRQMEPKNTFFLRKCIKTMKIPVLEVKHKANVPLPDNLKPRHPLFGSNYEDKIQLSEDAERRLQKAIEECLKEQQKAHKKKKKKQKPTDDSQNEVIFNLLGNHTSKVFPNSQARYNASFDSSDSHISGSKKAKKKKSLNSSEQLMTEDETPHNKKKHKLNENNDGPVVLKNIKSELQEDEIIEDHDEIEESIVLNPIVNNKKKKKSLENSSFSAESSGLLTFDIPHKKKNKPKDNVILKNIKTELQENEILENHEEMEVPNVTSPIGNHVSKKAHKKEKKRRPSIFGDTNMFESTRVDDYRPDENILNKQSTIEDTLSRIKTELLTEYESEVDDKSTKKKKKKKRKSLQSDAEDIIDNADNSMSSNKFVVNNIKKELMVSDYMPSSSKKRKRTMSMVEDRNEKERIGNKIVTNIVQELMVSDYMPSSSKKRRRTMSVVEDSTEVKKNKKKKNGTFVENKFSLENELDSLLEKVKREKKMQS